MKKFIAALLLLISIHSFSQKITNDKSVNFEIGFGAIMPKISNNVYVGSGNLSFATSGEAHLSYTKDRITFGIKAIYYKYATETDSIVRFANATGGSILFTTTYDFVYNQKFAAYVSTGVGVGGLNYERHTTNNLRGSVEMNGFAAQFGLGFRYHFSKTFGFFMQSNFNTSTYNMKSFIVNGNQETEFENRPVEDVIFTFRGMDLKLGLRLAFSKSKEIIKEPTKFL